MKQRRRDCILFGIACAISIFLFQNCSNQGFNTEADLFKYSTSTSSSESSEIDSCDLKGSCESTTNDAPVVQPNTNIGWSQAPNTKFSDICVQVQGAFGFTQNCRTVFTAWNGAVADTNKNRLVIWGGGHNDYYGNEIYSFDLSSQKILRLNDPTPLSSKPACMTTLPDGRPTSRHTYGGIGFIPYVNKMVMFGGSPSCYAGGLASDAWLLDFTELARDPEKGNYWNQISSSIPQLPYGGILGSVDYDPVSKLTYLFTSSGALYSYNADLNQFKLINYYNTKGYHFTGVIDPKLRIFLLIGAGIVYQINIDTGILTELSGKLSGCDTLTVAPYPGLAFYPEQNKVVGWAGGASVYFIDMQRLQCTEKKYSSTIAPGPQLSNGTNGRFRYFPALKTFVLANDPDKDIYLLKMDP